MSGQAAPPASEERTPRSRAERMAEAVRLVVTTRERAPRSPRMAHALKRLIWRYSREAGRANKDKEENTDVTR